MKVVLVRHIETKEIQGVFWGTDAEIWDCFDELGDPFDCEYARIDTGGGAIYTHASYGEGAVARQYQGMSEYEIETGHPNENDHGFEWKGFNSSESLWSALHYQDRLEWKRFDPADKRHGLIARAQNASR